MTKLLDFAFASHGFASGIKQIDICKVFRWVGFGVFGAFARRMLLGASVNIFCVTSIEAAVNAFEDVNVEQPAVICHGYSGDKQSNTTPFCIALLR